MKRVVVLEWKDNRVPARQVYKSVSELVRKNGYSINIGLQALWNALSKGGGVYENKLCSIKYEEVL